MSTRKDVTITGRRPSEPRMQSIPLRERDEQQKYILRDPENTGDLP